jgi:hypothetical protein
VKVLVTRGFPFCDEGEPEQPQFPPPPPLEGQAQGGAAAAVEPLLLEGVEASSADSPQQGISARIACQWLAQAAAHSQQMNQSALAAVVPGTCLPTCLLPSRCGRLMPCFSHLLPCRLHAG